MLKKLFSKFGTTLYVQIWEHRIKVSDVKSGQTFDEKPLVAIKETKKGQKVISAVGNSAFLVTGKNIEVINPFSHPRVLFSNFEVGEKLLHYIFHVLLSKNILTPSPATVIHPMEKTEGGLTAIEIRAFKELALGAGARDVVVYQGPEFPLNGFNYETIKSSNDIKS